MISMFDKIEQTKNYILERSSLIPEVGIILGTGLSSFLDNIDIETSIEYHDIPHFVQSTVASHRGRIVMGKCNKVNVAILQGRFHYYEGYDMEEITLSVRVLKALGAKTLIVTNAAGGINSNYHEGEIIAISDHINFFPSNPLRGINDDRLGLRFPDLLNCYSPGLRSLLSTAAKQLDETIKHGVYFGWQGPNLETAAEYEMIHRLGADLVGMSSIPEVLVARHSNMEVLGISIVSNICYPIDKIGQTTLEQVIETVSKSGQKLSKILHKFFELYA